VLAFLANKKSRTKSRDFLQVISLCSFRYLEDSCCITAVYL